MSAAATDVGARVHVTRAIVVTSYVVLGAILAWSRLYGLGNGGYCCDEIATVTDSIRRGPSWILSGAYSPNNHQLFSLFGWAASSLVGESRGAPPPRRSCAVHRRSRPRDDLAARSLRRALRAPVSLSRDGVALAPRPLATGARLRDRLSRHERGRRRGARAAAIEQDVGDRRALRRRSRRRLDAPALHGRVPRDWRCAPRGRMSCARQLALGLGLSIAAIAAWYAPHVDDILDSSQQEYAVEISSAWIVTAALDQTLVPAFSLLSDDYLHPDLASLRSCLCSRSSGGEPPADTRAPHSRSCAGRRDDPRVLGDGHARRATLLQLPPCAAVRPGSHRRGGGARSTSASGPPSGGRRSS